MSDFKELGVLFWFSVASHPISKYALYDKLVKSGLGTEWMPNPIKARDAFRRATNDIQGRQKTEKEGVYKNLFVREIENTVLTTRRNIIIETVDRNKNKVNYESEVGSIQLDLPSSKLFYEENDKLKDVYEEIERNFSLYKEYYSPSTIRGLIPDVLSGLAPIPMRGSSGIYYIPSKFADVIEHLTRFINSLKESEAYQIKVIDEYNNRKMLQKRLSLYIKHLFNQFKNTETMRRSQLMDLSRKMEKILDDYKYYESFIELDVIDEFDLLLEELEAKISELNILIKN